MAKVRIFINSPSSEQLKKFPKIGRELIVKGRQQRFVTHQEIEGALPPIEDNLDLIEEFVEILQDLGVEIIDQKKAIVWNKKIKEEEEEEDVDEKNIKKKVKKKEKKLTDLTEIANDSIRMYLSEIGRV
ncbi:MAG: RNA polymerase sigma factor region1.1 domain-containing protein, partial [Patescibacteria group bacterium]